MIEIGVSSLAKSFGGDKLFENVTFDVKTKDKIGLIGRNGTGKTTLMKILAGCENYQGGLVNKRKGLTIGYLEQIPSYDDENTVLDVLNEAFSQLDEIRIQMEQLEKSFDSLKGDELKAAVSKYSSLHDSYELAGGYSTKEKLNRIMHGLEISEDMQKRQFNKLSGGEKTRIILGKILLEEPEVLLLDEPSNHLDIKSVEWLEEYLNAYNGTMVMVSHDRYFLDRTVDHILSINKNNIEVQKGNFSSWQENKDRQDNYEISQNDKLKKEINQLETAFRRTAGWSDKVEKSKIGEHSPDRGYIGHKAAKMMKRAKSIELRKENSLNEKRKLLKNIEKYDSLKVIPSAYHKDTLINVDNLSVSYGERTILNNVSFTINQGDRIALRGKNGSGKSTILKILVGKNENYRGTVNIGSNLNISYVPQDTSFLNGSFSDFIITENINESIFRTLLAKLDMDSYDFSKNLEELSEGQKKKVLIAKSLSQSSHIYIWDEPLNFIDVYSRIQIEELINEFEPTMIFVEHDRIFNENIATKEVHLT
ncbi:MAG TPA: ABC-F type ribosomal protection protein [Clostridiales bacterium]|nr:ABC-F type ribosomal protection protein [Clostridiales bacterium]